jgi:hypothetical protein
MDHRGPGFPRPMARHNHRVHTIFALEPLVEEVREGILRAESRVYADFYVLGGQCGRAIAEALIDRHRKGLDVRVILDGNIGTF